MNRAPKWGELPAGAGPGPPQTTPTNWIIRNSMGKEAADSMSAPTSLRTVRLREVKK